MKIALIFLFIVLGRAEQAASPEVKAVPEVEVAPKADEVQKKVNGSLTGNRPTDIGVIKTEKSISAKNCKMIAGEIKCVQKKSRRKVIK